MTHKALLCSFPEFSSQPFPVLDCRRRSLRDEVARRDSKKSSASAQRRCRMSHILSSNCCEKQAANSQTITHDGERVFFVHPPQGAQGANLPRRRWVLGGETPLAIRPWKQECFDKRETGRVISVNTERSWATLTVLTQWRPETSSYHVPRLGKLGLACGCFMRCRTCDG